MQVRSKRESLSPAESKCDCARGDLSLLLHETMSNHDKGLAMEEVEHPVVDVCMLHPELVDPVPHQIGFGSSELVAQLGEPTEPGAALRSRLGKSSSNHGRVPLLESGQGVAEIKRGGSMSQQGR